MKNFIKWNINREVKIKLTAHGKKLLEDYYFDCGINKEDITKTPDAKGKYTFQMWEVMNIFGPSVWNGCVMPFDADISIELDLVILDD